MERGARKIALQVAGNATLGATTDAPASISADEDTTAKSLVAIAKALKNLTIDIKTLFETTGINLLPLSSTIDSMDIAKMSKGAVSSAVTLGLSAVDATTTSTEIDMRGFNYIAVSVSVAADFDWTFKLMGSMTSGGTYIDMYDGANQCVSATIANGSRIIMWPCGTPYAKIVATEGESGTTATVSAVLFNR